MAFVADMLTTIYYNFSSTSSMLGPTISPLLDDMSTHHVLNATDNSTNHSSTEFRSVEDMYELHRPTSIFIHKLVIPIWWAIGFPGNCLAFSVWIQPCMRPSSGCYLAALAMTDLVFLILHVLFELQFTWRVSVIEFPFLCEVYPMIFLASQYLSVMLVLAFTVERYISICHPFKRETYCTTHRAVRVIGALIATTVVINAVQMYFWSYSYEHASCDIRPEVTTTATDGNISVWTVWSWITELLVFGAVPLTILSLNFLVIVELRRISFNDPTLLEHSKSLRRQKSNENGRHRNSGGGSGSSSATTVMLFAVSFYLICATLPVTFIYILHQRFPIGNVTLTDEEIRTDAVWQTHFTFLNIRVAVQDFGMSHFALNFYLYLITGKIFRRELCRLFSRCASGYPQRVASVLWPHTPSSEMTEIQSFARFDRRREDNL